MKDRVSPNEALERLFEVIRQEASANPKFAARMLEASGFTVVFQGPDAGKIADPIAMAGSVDETAFRESFLSLPEKDLKSVIKNFALATDAQVTAVKTKPKAIGYVDLIWKGSERLLRERRG